MCASVFSDLDCLYSQILSTYNDSKVLVRILGVVLALKAVYTDFLRGYWISTTAEGLADMAGIGEDKVQLVLCALQSIIKVQVKQVYDNWDDAQPNGTIYQEVQLCHRSFHDFLTDSLRAGPFFINTHLCIGQIICRILELATMSIKFFKRCLLFVLAFKKLTECSSSGSFSTISQQTWCQFEFFLSCYRFKMNWRYHQEPCGIDKKELCSQVDNLLDTLFNNHLLFSKHSFETYTSLIPVLHCVCSALYVCELYSVVSLCELIIA